jgi:hypothetical protein
VTWTIQAIDTMASAGPFRCLAAGFKAIGTDHAEQQDKSGKRGEHPEMTLLVRDGGVMLSRFGARTKLPYCAIMTIGRLTSREFLPCMGTFLY